MSDNSSCKTDQECIEHLMKIQDQLLESMTLHNVKQQYTDSNRILNNLISWEHESSYSLRNQIIRDFTISPEQIRSHLIDWASKQIENISDIDDDILRNSEQQKISKLLSEYILSLYQDNILNKDDLKNVVSYTCIKKCLLVHGNILSNPVISILKELPWLDTAELIINLTKQYYKNNDEAYFANIKILQEIITPDPNHTPYLLHIINSVVRLIEDNELLSNCEKNSSLLKESKDIPQIQNEVDMLQIAVLTEKKELTELLLKSNPGLVYAQNADGVSLVEFLEIFLEKDSKAGENYEDTNVVQIIAGNYYEDTSSEQNKILSYDLAILLREVVPEIIYKTTNPLFELIKEDFVLTEDFFNNKKTHILIASDEGDWSNSFIVLSNTLRNNFPDVLFHLINKDVWEKCDKNLLAKFDGFIIPAAEDKYPYQWQFKLSDMGEENFLPLNKLSINMLEFAQENNIPSIGSCAGAQATILVSGGSLVRLEERLDEEAIEIEIKPGTMPYFMSLPIELQTSILKAQNNDYPKSLIIKGDINCGFLAESEQLGEGVILAGVTSDSCHYPVCYSKGLIFATQYHPEVPYIKEKYTGIKHEAQQNYIDSFINFAKIHHELGGKYLAIYVANIENNLHNLFDQGEVENLMGDNAIQANDYQDCALAA